MVSLRRVKDSNRAKRRNMLERICQRHRLGASKLRRANARANADDGTVENDSLAVALSAALAEQGDD